MKSSESNRKNVDTLTDRLGRAFQDLDRLKKRDLSVIQTDIAGVRCGRQLAALRRQLERDPDA